MDPATAISIARHYLSVNRIGRYTEFNSYESRSNDFFVVVASCVFDSSSTLHVHPGGFVEENYIPPNVPGNNHRPGDAQRSLSKIQL